LNPKKDKHYQRSSQVLDQKLKQTATKKQDSNYIEKNIQCTYCNSTITVEGAYGEHFTLNCPMCKKELTVSFSKKKPIEKEKSKKEKTKDKKTIKNISSFILSNIIEIIIILFGLSFLNNPTLSNIKISFSLVLIGTILMSIMSNTTSSEQENTLAEKPIPFKKNKKENLIKQKTNKILSHRFIKNISQSLSDKIAIILILWILLLFIITGETQVEIFFILIFIGMLIIRELTDNLATIPLKHRLNAFIIVFLLAYIVIISEKMINILNM